MSAAPSPFDPVEASLADRLQAVREARELAARLRDLTAAHPDLRPAVLDTLGGTVPVPVTTPEPAPPPPAEPPPPVTRFHLVLFQSGSSRDNFGSLNHLVFGRVQEHLNQVITTPPQQTEIDVWLESPGGDAHAAYKLFLDLQYRCRRLRAVIPDYAKSAATLLVLGVDQFFMGPSAELGPLDAQIEHPDRENLTVSALDVSKALGFLGDFGIDYIVVGGQRVFRTTDLPRIAVLREMARYSAAFLKPVVSKLDPHLIHRATYQLAVARSYARTMLNLRRLSPEDQVEGLDFAGLVDELIESYPAHEYVISRSEAADLPLPVRHAEQYDRWLQVRQLHYMFRAGWASSNDLESLIEVWRDVEIEERIADFLGDYDEQEEADIPDGDNPADGDGHEADEPAGDAGR